MSDDLTVIGAIYEAFGKGDIPTILGHLADDVRWEEWSDNSAQKAGVPWMQAGRGQAGVLAFFQALSQLQFHGFGVVSMMAGGNQVAAEVAMERYVDGKMAETRVSFDMMGLLQQIGVIPTPQAG